MSVTSASKYYSFSSSSEEDCTDGESDWKHGRKPGFPRPYPPPSSITNEQPSQPQFLPPHLDLSVYRSSSQPPPHPHYLPQQQQHPHHPQNIIPNHINYTQQQLQQFSTLLQQQQQLTSQLQQQILDMKQQQQQQFQQPPPVHQQTPPPNFFATPFYPPPPYLHPPYIPPQPILGGQAATNQIREQQGDLTGTSGANLGTASIKDKEFDRLVEALTTFRGMPDKGNVAASVAAFESFINKYATDINNRIRVILDHNIFTEKLWDRLIDKFNNNTYNKIFYDNEIRKNIPKLLRSKRFDEIADIYFDRYFYLEDNYINNNNNNNSNNNKYYPRKNSQIAAEPVRPNPGTSKGVQGNNPPPPPPPTPKKPAANKKAGFSTAGAPIPTSPAEVVNEIEKKAAEPNPVVPPLAHLRPNENNSSRDPTPPPPPNKTESKKGAQQQQQRNQGPILDGFLFDRQEWINFCHRYRSNPLLKELAI